MDLYIRGAGILSPAGDNNGNSFLSTAPDYETDRLLCKEPDYKSYIPPMQLRRMSKAVRMGIGAARICLQDAGVEKADAISVGTALGCIHDTEVFLSKMVDQDEQMLTPTAFIQSTHNTVAGQIALVTGCHGHNLTYVHRGHSFEHAMINSQLYLNLHRDENILVGGIEELTDSSIDVFKQLGVYRNEISTPESVVTGSAYGSIAGEGANFFLLSSKPEGAKVHIKGIETFASREAKATVTKVQNFLDRNNLKASAIDLVLLGVNGDNRSIEFYDSISHSLFKENSQSVFKHLSGEYPVASSFGLGLICAGRNIKLPEFLILKKPPKEFKTVLIVNNFLHHYSCWLLEII
jgi:hypothetical protein